MRRISLILGLVALIACPIVLAQTRPSPQAPKEREIEIDSDSGDFEGLTNEIIYTGHVFVTDHVQSRLHCARLTVDLPPQGGQPTNIVAETNVVIDYLDDKGQTNHITAARAVYTYLLLNRATNFMHAVTNNRSMTITNVFYATTNETITFSGGHPTSEGPSYTLTGDPLVYDVPTKRFRGFSQSVFRQRMSGTNSSPFDMFKRP